MSSGRVMFYPWCIFILFFATVSLTDRPETLLHGRNLVVFYNPTPKIRGLSPKKFWGPKTCKISVNFGQLQTSIANISGTAENIQNPPTSRTMAIPPAFNENSPVNFGLLTAWIYVWVWTHWSELFWHTVSWPLGGAAPRYFYTRSRPSLASALPNSDGGHRNKFQSWKLKTGLKLVRVRLNNFRATGSILTGLLSVDAPRCRVDNSVQLLQCPPPKVCDGQKIAQIFRDFFYNFRLWSLISLERINISKIGKALDHLQSLPR